MNVCVIWEVTNTHPKMLQICENIAIAKRCVEITYSQYEIEWEESTGMLYGEISNGDKIIIEEWTVREEPDHL